MNWHPIKPLLGPNKHTKWEEEKKLSKISGLKLKLVLLSRTRDRLKSSKKWLWQFFKPCVRIFSATSDQSAASSPKKKWIQAAQVKPKSSKATKHSRSIPLSWQCDQSPITFRLNLWFPYCSKPNGTAEKLKNVRVGSWRDPNQKREVSQEFRGRRRSYQNIVQFQQSWSIPCRCRRDPSSSQSGWLAWVMKFSVLCVLKQISWIG